MKLLDFHGLTEEQVKSRCQELFEHTYVRDPAGHAISLKTKDGIAVRFAKCRWWHAISYKDEAVGVRKLSFQRARRLLWPKMVITGAIQSEYRDLIERGKRKRYYYVAKKRYVLILAYNKREELTFRTHFLPLRPGEELRIQRKIRAKK